MITLNIGTIERKASSSLVTTVTAGNDGWFTVLSTLRERFSGAWQRGLRVSLPDMMTYSTVWSCVTLIASDISKLCPEIHQEDAHGISQDVKNSPFLKVLDKPNHYQNRIKFLESWVLAKLLRGNAYVLKEREPRRGLVTALYPLDPSRVQVVVAPDGQVYYQLSQDFLSGIIEKTVTVPASEIIHDVGVPLYHPLIGVSPVHACGMAAAQALRIQEHTAILFANGSNPGGVLTAPGTINQETADRVQKHWEENFAGTQNVGRVAVLGDGLKYEAMGITAVDAQLIEQLKWSSEQVCAVFHVPAYMVGAAAAPSYNNVEALNQQYYSQCLQTYIESIELCLDEGLEIPSTYCVELDLDGLLRMDSATKMKFATDGVKGGVLTPNDGREMFNKPPLTGGDTVYLQQQDYSLAALDARDRANPAPSSAEPAPPAPSKPIDAPPVPRALPLDPPTATASDNLTEDAIEARTTREVTELIAA